MMKRCHETKAKKVREKQRMEGSDRVQCAKRFFEGAPPTAHAMSVTLHWNRVDITLRFVRAFFFLFEEERNRNAKFVCVTFDLAVRRIWKVRGE